MKDSYYYYELGLQKYQSKDLHGALVNFLVSATLSQHFKTYEQLYHVLNDLGFVEESGFMIWKAYQLNSNNDKIAFLYANSLIEQHKVDDAREVLLCLLERNGTYMPAKRLLDEFRS